MNVILGTFSALMDFLKTPYPAVSTVVVVDPTSVEYWLSFKVHWALVHVLCFVSFF